MRIVVTTKTKQEHEAFKRIVQTKKLCCSACCSEAWMIFLPTKYKSNDGQDVLAVRLSSYKNDKELCVRNGEKSFVWGKDWNLVIFFTLNLPSDFPKMQFSFCTIINICIFKFACGCKAHVLQTDVKPCVIRFDVWYFSILSEL